MDNDLISRKAVLDIIKPRLNSTKKGTLEHQRIYSVYMSEGNMPAAYNVDRVMERLEVNSMFAQADEEPFVVLDDAIEIVKSGRIE